MFNYTVKCDFNHSEIRAKNRQQAIEKATTLATILGQPVTLTLMGNRKMVIMPINMSTL